MEFAGAEILFSVIAVVLNMFDVITTRFPIVAMLVIFILLYLVINTFQLRLCYEDAPDSRQYYIVNFLAYGIFIAFTVLSYLFAPGRVHTWLFSLTKFLCYLELNAWLSMFVFFGVLAIVIFVAPAGIYIVEVDNEEDMNRLSDYGRERAAMIDYEEDESYDENIEPGYIGDEDDWDGISIWED